MVEMRKEITFLALILFAFACTKSNKTPTFDFNSEKVLIEETIKIL